jgi:hypothetical protein
MDFDIPYEENLLRLLFTENWLKQLVFEVRDDYDMEEIPDKPVPSKFLTDLMLLTNQKSSTSLGLL